MLRAKRATELLSRLGWNHAMIPCTMFRIILIKSLDSGDNSTLQL